MNILDYVWYRIALVYYKWDSDGVTASGFLTLTEGIFLLNLFQVISRRTGTFQEIFTSTNSSIYIGLLLALLAYNYFRYKNKYWRLRDKWIKEPKGLPYILKGMGVLTFLLLPWIWFFMLVQFKK